MKFWAIQRIGVPLRPDRALTAFLTIFELAVQQVKCTGKDVCQLTHAITEAWAFWHNICTGHLNC